MATTVATITKLSRRPDVVLTACQGFGPVCSAAMTVRTICLETVNPSWKWPYNFGLFFLAALRSRCFSASPPFNTVSRETVEAL